MNDTLVISAMGTLIVLAFSIAWGLLRAEVTTLRKDNEELRREVVKITTESARSEERDKANEKGFEQLRKALADMDRQLGERISDLARVVADGLRVRYPGYRPTPSPPRSYIGPPLPREEENDK